MADSNQQISQIIIKALKDPEFKKKLLQNPKKTIEAELKKYLVLPHLSEAVGLREHEIKEVIAGSGCRWTCCVQRTSVPTNG